MPLPASGSMHEAPTITNSRMNRAGIIVFEARSMPLRTPCRMTKWVMPKKSTAQKIGLKALPLNSLK